MYVMVCLFVLVFVNVCDGTRCQRSSEDLGLAIEGGETNCGRKCSLAFCRCLNPRVPACSAGRQLVECFEQNAIMLKAVVVVQEEVPLVL